MKKRFISSFVEAKFLIARCLTLLVLALLSTNLAWGENVNDKVYTFGSTVPSGWTVNAATSAASSYLKIKAGETITTSSITTLIPEGNVLSSSIKLNVSCGTFGSWSGEKKVTVKAQLLDSNGEELSQAEFTKSSLSNSENTYLAEDYPIELTKPTDVTKINALKITFSIPNGADVLRVKNVKLSYSYEKGGTPTKTLTSIAISGTPNKTTYETGEEFDPAGLKVMGTYEGQTDPAEITSGITWTFDPAKFTSTTQNSVSVTATVDGKSDTKNYTVTVTEHVVTPGTYEISLNNALYGISTGNNGTEQSVKSHDITIVSGCSSSASSKTYYDTNHIRYYADCYLKLSVPDGYEITSIVFAEPSSSKTWNGSITSTPDSYNADTKTWTGKSQNVDFAFGAQNRPASIKVTYTTAKVKTLKAISISGQKTTFYKGDEFEFGGTVMASYNEEDVDDEDVTSKAEFTGYDMATAGTQTITVTYEDKTTTYDITVKTIANTKETAYTTAGAIALIDAGKDLTTSVYVKGKVSQVDSYNDTYKSITYWLDNNAFEVYSGKGLNNTDFNSVDDIAVGADVIVYGTIKKHNSTYEFEYNNYLVSYAAPTKTLPTISAEYKESLNVGGDDDEYTVEYSGDGELSIASSNEDVAEAIIVEGTVVVEAKAAGTTTITISAAETDNYYATSMTYTLTVVGPASLPFAFDGGYAAIANTTGMSQVGLEEDYKTSPKLKFDDTGDNVVIWFNGPANYVSYDIKGNSFSGGTFNVQESADGTNYTIVESYTTLENSAKNEFKTLNANTRYVKFIYTNKSSGNVALGNIKIGRGQDVTITTAKYATLGLPYAVTIPKDVSAYTATVDGNTVTLSKINKSGGSNVIPANCGVILYAETPKTYTFTETADVDAITGNQLVAVIGETYTCGNDYGKDYYLGLSNGQATFKKLASGGTIAAGKAYLKLDEELSEGAKLEVTFGEPTGIENITPALSEGKEVYNLNGMKVNSNYKGIVIMNGKKYINK